VKTHQDIYSFKIVQRIVVTQPSAPLAYQTCSVVFTDQFHITQVMQRHADDLFIAQTAESVA